MLPPPGLEPSGASALLDNASSTVAAAATSFLNIVINLPSPTSTLVVVIATATSLADNHLPQTRPNHGEPPSRPDNGECRLLGPFAIFVQGALGLLALLALVYKRWRERPQRPVKIWFFDVSKQVVGSVLVHIANLLMSMLSSGQLSIKVEPSSVTRRALGMSGLFPRMVDGHGKYTPNPCSFYLLNLAIDTTIGIPILILLLRILTALFALTSFGTPRESITSGNYGSPPRAWWWFKQSILYFIGLMGMKICVLIIFLVFPWISRVGDWALRWTEGDEVLQVVFVMLVFPVIMNATQYYIIDSFIKNQNPDGLERIPDHDADDGFDGLPDDAYEDTRSGSSDEIGTDDEADPEIKAKADAVKEVAKKRGHGGSSRPGSSRRDPGGLKPGGRDYDPLFDGESSPTVVGSANTSERETLVMKEGDSEDETEARATK